MAERVKPQKPYLGFPLYPHPNGQWCKKIRGKLYYFGAWDDPQAAVERYQEEREALHAGRTPRRKGDGLELADLCNLFMASREAARDAGELTDGTYRNYLRAARELAAFFGKRRLVDDLTAADFADLRVELGVGRGPAALGLQVRQIRIIFRWGYEQGLFDQPVRFGSGFQQPPKRLVRQAAKQNGPRMFEPAEIRALIDAADQPVKSTILLAINAAYSPADLARVPLHALDLAGGWVDFDRPKTGVGRRACLWRETTEALTEWIGGESRERVFPLTEGGIAAQFRKLTKEQELWHPRRGIGKLRHTFRTIADEVRDWPAVNLVMGHVDPSIASHYRERISDDRLRTVAQHVRQWLFDDKADDGQGEEPDVVQFSRIG